jgi:hypothetical protein
MLVILRILAGLCPFVLPGVQTVQTSAISRGSEVVQIKVRVAMEGVSRPCLHGAGAIFARPLHLSAQQLRALCPQLLCGKTSEGQPSASLISSHCAWAPSLGSARPVFRSDHDQITCRVLHLGVHRQISDNSSQAALQFAVGSGA